MNKCNGGGKEQLNKLTNEARVWWCFKNTRIIMDAWFRNRLMDNNVHETIDRTIHFCRLAIMKHEGTTQAWPMCDPFQKECNGGKFPNDIIGKCYEWAYFNAHKRAQVSNAGLSFKDWVKVKFGDIQLNKQIEVH